MNASAALWIQRHLFSTLCVRYQISEEDDEGYADYLETEMVVNRQQIESPAPYFTVSVEIDCTHAHSDGLFLYIDFPERSDLLIYQLDQAYSLFRQRVETDRTMREIARRMGVRSILPILENPGESVLNRPYEPGAFESRCWCDPISLSAEVVEAVYREMRA